LVAESRVSVCIWVIPKIAARAVIDPGFIGDLERLCVFDVPLTTLDGDVALPAKLKIEESTVRERLIDAGFLEEFVGEDRRPATHYHYGPAGGFYVEFLTPLVGSEYGRKGKRKARLRKEKWLPISRKRQSGTTTIMIHWIRCFGVLCLRLPPRTQRDNQREACQCDRIDYLSVD
jgi:hypothetical protein